MDPGLVQSLAELPGEDQQDGVLCRGKFDESTRLDRLDDAFTLEGTEQELPLTPPMIVYAQSQAFRRGNVISLASFV